MAKQVETRESPMLEMRASFVPSTINEESRTVDLVWTTGHKGLRRTWDGDYYEELRVDTDSVRLERLNSGAPLLDMHNQYRLDAVIGVVERAWIEDGIGHATVRFARDETSEVAYQKVRDGILRNISVGYAVYRYEIDDADKDIPTYRATDWEPMELSLVTIGFDPAAQTRSATRTVQTEIVRSDDVADEEEAAPATTVESEEMNEDEKRAADLKAAQEAGSAAERTRVSGINAIVRKAGLEVTEAERMIESGITLDAARAEVIDLIAARQSASQPETRGQTVIEGENTALARRDAMGTALEARVNHKVKLDGMAREYRGMSLIEMAAESVRAAGGEPRGLSKREIAQAAMNCNHHAVRAAGMHSTSDFPLILANTLSKTLRAAYELAPQTFAPFTRRTTLSDFKPASRVALGDLDKLLKVSEGGEYKYGTLGEEGVTIQLVKYGRIVAITWEAIINDDLSAFSRLPQAIGVAGNQLESDTVYNLILANPNYTDGKAIFHADHGNLAASGGAINTTTLAAARAAMRKQVSIAGHFLNIEPRYLVVGPAKELEAFQFTSSNYVPAKNADINDSRNASLVVIVDARITDNRWYLFAEPGMVDTIEYAYLEGEDGMFTETREGFEVDGMEVKARLVFGASWIDYRGAYLNPGA